MMRAMVRSSDNSIRAMATTLILAGLLFLTATPSSGENAGSSIKVVTTLTVLADLVREVGRGRVTVASLSDPRQDPHFVQPDADEEGPRGRRVRRSRTATGVVGAEGR
jgi:hypothetical protein